MIKRIIVGGFLFCLLIAIPLSFLGIERVELGGPFLGFLRATSIELSKYKFEIPNIPSIPLSDAVGTGWDILRVLTNFVNFFVTVINAVINIFNIIIMLFEFIGLLIKNLITFKDTVATYPLLFQ